MLINHLKASINENIRLSPKSMQKCDMPKTFNCPTCSAPLRLLGETIVRCTYCGGSIVAPETGSKEKSERFDDEQRAKLETVLKAVLAHDQAHYPNIVINLRDKDELGTVAKEIGLGHDLEAVSIMQRSYGYRDDEAKQLVRNLSKSVPFDLKSIHDLDYIDESRKGSFQVVVYALFIVFIIGFLAVVFSILD